MEMVNKVFQQVLRRLGPNISQPTILKYTGAALGLQQVRDKVREELGLANVHRRDPGQDRHDDVMKVVKVLVPFKPFTADPSRNAAKFTVATYSLSGAKRETFSKFVLGNQKNQSWVGTFWDLGDLVDPEFPSLTDALENATLFDTDNANNADDADDVDDPEDLEDSESAILPEY